MSSIICTSRVAIVGLGQLGASLALRLQEISCISLYGIARRSETLEKAMELNMIDGGSTEAEDVLPVVDITFICLPIPATIAFVKENLSHFRIGSIVTDVSSVKQILVDEIRNSLYDHGTYFIGSHPMAGTEKSGMNHGRSDLYKDAITFITPTEEDEPFAIDLVRTFWQDIGAFPIEIDAKRHDNALAFSSHLLHILSSCLTKIVLGNGDIEAKYLGCAGSFRDMSRISSSDPEMWSEISRYNRHNLLESMDCFQSQFNKLRKKIEEENWKELLEILHDSQMIHQEWIKKNQSKTSV